jgi:DNA (cytosine-5)-methyltransferase 1
VIYGSVCSGIEAASVAWHPLGWRAAFLSEIEPFPRAVLAHRFPNVPLHGDFTTIEAGQYEPIDLLVGGTPCQSFSIAGLRGGLADDRGNLALEFLRLADRLRPRWLVWENVPGVLSSNGGRDFGAILGGMVELGYGFAYRVLDAQFAGVPQRRRRVFVVGYLGDWRRAAAVLFERHSLQGHNPPRREKRKGVAPTISACPTGGGGLGTDFDLDGGLIQWPAEVCLTLDSYYGDKMGLEDQHVFNQHGGKFVSSPVAYRTAGDGAVYEEGDATAPLTTATDPSASIVAFDTTQVTSASNYSNPKPGDPCHPLASGAHAPAVAFQTRIARNGRGQPDEIVPALSGADAGATSDMRPCIATSTAVRRLTPMECERLQGFPDQWTLVPHRGKPAADGPRYKALGNSMAIPVVRWLGQRIASVEAIIQSEGLAA